MKTIFVTGASSGIGKAAVKLFHSHGWKVIATMRSPEKETELSQLKNVTILPLDVTDVKQIKSTVEEAILLDKIDIVLNNAGYALFGAMEAFRDEQITRQINTNLLGTMRVTQAFIPYFREKKNGLFINITSIAGLVAYPFSHVYHATKWALEGWSESLSIELAPFNIGVKTISPSGTQSDFLTRSSDLVSHPVYDDAMQKMLGGFKFTNTAEQVAEIICEAATDDKDQLRYLAGESAKATYARRLEIGAEEFRKEITQTYLALQKR
ncbi:NADP-dependent 3-hydroxy acid dehydrogenase YdfG [Pedobacter westerhofensis]|uniref:NADP-dependent 3-hydroxy acid dehydrogenase YdfG n=1 Tax=Pedobacter westerhofensis TaxID=425512 RepID=A0A521FRZ0_9SPHI|nr:SDR family oxidoreductase [Pedobacter westerhofensis]SMO99005.1 NADP-dependent 3-hydroxy acid dehydrogenase YdfG [Pedobacter westerhofensis]